MKFNIKSGQAGNRHPLKAKMLQRWLVSSDGMESKTFLDDSGITLLCTVNHLPKTT